MDQIAITSRCIVQRQLSLPLSPPPPNGHDRFGDSLLAMIDKTSIHEAAVDGWEAWEFAFHSVADAGHHSKYEVVEVVFPPCCITFTTH